MARMIQIDIFMGWTLVVKEKKRVSRMDCGVFVWAKNAVVGWLPVTAVAGDRKSVV